MRSIICKKHAVYNKENAQKRKNIELYLILVFLYSMIGCIFAGK